MLGSLLLWYSHTCPPQGCELFEDKAQEDHLIALLNLPHTLAE